MNILKLVVNRLYCAVFAAGAEVAIPLDTIRAYLVGVIAITGGTGLSASLLEF